MTTLLNEVFESTSDSVEIDIDRIIVNEELQIRKHTDPKLVKKYSDQMRNGARFPPLNLWEVEGRLIVVDGFHRLEAARWLTKSVLATVTQGSFEEAKVASAKANLKHGRSLSSSERIYAFRSFIMGNGHVKKTGALMSYREIAEELFGVVSKSAIHRWMHKHFPWIAKKMSKEEILGNANAGLTPPSFEESLLDQAWKGMEITENCLKGIRSPEARGWVISRLDELLAEAKREPYQVPDF